jgi:hypothetical protein
MAGKAMKIEKPLVIMFETPDGVICHLYPSETANSHRHYGMLVCDLVRHVARAFEVEEQDVWEWVDKERDHPTTDITRPS